MNCKPGDLAFVLGDSPICLEHTAGVVVEVIRFIGAARARMPDGTLTEGAPTCWIIKFPRKLHLKARNDKYNFTQYASCPDRYLRPIRPGDISDEEVCDLYAPSDPLQIGQILHEGA